MSSAIAAQKEPPRQLREWLARHEQQCLGAVEMCMTRSLPVAARVIAAVRPDPAWSDALRNAVIWPVHEDGTREPDAAAFVAAADAERGLGVITLDGETQWLSVDAVAIPQPVHMSDLEEVREFATELGLEQHLHQLHRDRRRRVVIRLVQDELQRAEDASLCRRASRLARRNARSRERARAALGSLAGS